MAQLGDHTTRGAGKRVFVALLATIVVFASIALIPSPTAAAGSAADANANAGNISVVTFDADTSLSTVTYGSPSGSASALTEGTIVGTRTIATITGIEVVGVVIGILGVLLSGLALVVSAPPGGLDSPLVERAQIEFDPAFTGNFHVGDDRGYTFRNRILIPSCTDDGDGWTRMELFSNGELVNSQYVRGLDSGRYTYQSSGRLQGIDIGQRTIRIVFTASGAKCGGASSFWNDQEGVTHQDEDQATVTVDPPYELKLDVHPQNEVEHRNPQGQRVRVQLLAKSKTTVEGAFGQPFRGRWQGAQFVRANECNRQAIVYGTVDNGQLGGTVEPSSSQPEFVRYASSSVAGPPGSCVFSPHLPLIRGEDAPIAPAQTITSETSFQPITNPAHFGDWADHPCELVPERRLWIMGGPGITSRGYDMAVRIPSVKFNTFRRSDWVGETRIRPQTVSDICRQENAQAVILSDLPVRPSSLPSDPPGDTRSPTPMTGSGRVVDTAGNPIGGINITITDRNGTIVRTTTDESGRFSFDATLGYFLRLEYGDGPWFSSHSSTMYRPVLEKGALLQIGRDKTPLVKGKVLNQRGEPIPAEINLVTATGTVGLDHTRSDGSFTLGPLVKRGQLTDPTEMTLRIDVDETPARVFASTEKTVRIPITNESEIKRPPIVIEERFQPDEATVTYTRQFVQFDPISGQIQPVEGIDMEVVNTVTGEIVGTATTNESGWWTVEVPAGVELILRSSNAADYLGAAQAPVGRMTLMHDTESDTHRLPPAQSLTNATDVSITDLVIGQSPVEERTEVTITTTVRNTGSDMIGPLVIPLRIDGQIVDRQIVTLDANDVRTVTYTRTYDTPGTFDIAVGTSTAGRLVVDPGETPTSTPVKTPTPVTTSTPTAIQGPTDTETSTVEPTRGATTTTPGQPGFGLTATLVVLLLASLILLRRRK